MLMAVMVMTPSPAFAKKPGGGGTAGTGFDVSYPQCSTSLPAPVAFAIVGVNDGIVYSSNPCLSAQYGWATSATSGSTSGEPHVSFYANTADPGAAASTHWPSAQISPRDCKDAITAANPNGSPACDYDYGWYAAQDSFSRASSIAGQTAATAPWWLDVESANSWNDGAANNRADLQGALDYLVTSAHVPLAGLYTNSSTWSTYFGADNSSFTSVPSWVPGASTQSGAVQNCAVTVTGGSAYLAQYSASGLDADYDCR
jgi:hypothetical protein